jgi:LysM repeat protein
MGEGVLQRLLRHPGDQPAVQRRPEEVAERDLGGVQVHDKADSVQQGSRPAGGRPVIQRAQIGRVHTPAAGGTSHFIYELDATMSLFSQLASHYGVSVSAIQRANPGARATALRHGMRINIPANDPPATAPPVLLALPGPFLAPLIGSAMVHSTTTVPVAVRWSTTAGSNRIGRLPRGTTIALHYFGTGGAWMDIASLQSPATGIIDELRLRGIASSSMVFGYLPLANVRFTGGTTAAGDVNLIARMVWGEQRNQGNDAMAAAAWIARNRFDAGWGHYSQIVTRKQFHGLATPAQVTGLTGAELTAWTEAQRIAQGVADGTIADPTGTAVYFGNGTAVLRRMRACARRNAAFRHGTIAGTNFHYSNGDYTSAACTLP